MGVRPTDTLGGGDRRRPTARRRATTGSGTRGWCSPGSRAWVPSRSPGSSSRSGARPRSSLAAATGSAAALVAATGDPDGGSPTLTTAAAAGIRAAAARPDLALEPVRRSGVRVITLADEGYPSRLRLIELPPPVLFLAGDPAALDRPRRSPSSARDGPPRPDGRPPGGSRTASPALGATVVSGLALGIDGAAHAAAVRAGTPTVAVIGGGHERLYPAAHRVLARAIAGAGAWSRSSRPTPSRAGAPSRAATGSSAGSRTRRWWSRPGARSGALTTAAWALEQGRGLHLVPGRLDDPAVAGCLAFLREAGPEARIVAGVPELLEDLGLLAPGGRRLAPGDALLGTLSSVERGGGAGTSPPAWRRWTSSSSRPARPARRCSAP